MTGGPGIAPAHIRLEYGSQPRQVAQPGSRQDLAGTHSRVDWNAAGRLASRQTGPSGWGQTPLTAPSIRCLPHDRGREGERTSAAWGGTSGAAGGERL